MFSTRSQPSIYVLFCYKDILYIRLRTEVVDTVISCCFFPKTMVECTTPKEGVRALYGSRRVFPNLCLSFPSPIEIWITIFQCKENENNLISDENWYNWLTWITAVIFSCAHEHVLTLLQKALYMFKYVFFSQYTNNQLKTEENCLFRNFL